MSTDCDKKNPLVRGGTNQDERYPEPLNPSYVSVDERGIDDILVFAKEYASELNYFTYLDTGGGNITGKIDGDWTSFFEKDISVLISIISTKNVKLIQEQYNELNEDLARSVELNNEAEAKVLYRQYYDIVKSLGDDIINWRDSFAEESELLNMLINAQMSLADKFTALPDYDYNLPADYINATGAALFQKILDALTELDNIYDAFYKSYVKVVAFSVKFLKESLTQYPKHKPHLGLFLSFLALFEYAQKHINTITKRHLDFYYKEVLRLAEKPEVPDKVHIIFELAKNISTHLIEKDTLMKAGKDAAGVELNYGTDGELVVNKAAVKLLKNVHIDNSDLITSAPAANSRDGLGKALEKDDPKWQTFGKSQVDDSGTVLPEEERTMIFPDIGFAISSPILLLKEGARKVNIEFIFAKTGSHTQADLQNVFEIYLSGEKEWIKAESYTVFSDRMIEFTINPEQPAIVGYNDAVLKNGFDTTDPVLKILLKNTPGSDGIYSKLKDNTISALDIFAGATGVQNIILQNDLGVIKPGKPFQPFGPSPVVGSSFYIGSFEVFSKQLSSLNVNVEWHEIPNQNLTTYYDNYNKYDNSVSPPAANGFTASVKLLADKKWDGTAAVTSTSSLTNSVVLFAALADSPVKFEFDVSGFNRDVNMEEQQSYEVDSIRGFLKFVLTKDFFHTKFPNIYTAAVIDKVKSTTAVPLPNPPYTPTIKTINIEYVSNVYIDLASASNFESRADKFFHIYPFGYREAHPYYNSGNVETLLPLFAHYTDATSYNHNEGELYIGIENIEPLQNLSLLFQVAEGSSDPATPKPEVYWSYLVNNKWVNFESYEILSDTTDGIVNSGIISFAVPEKIAKDNTLLDAGYCWIRGCVTENSAGICQMIDIKAQAVLASFKNAGNDPNHLLAPLPAETISKLKIKQGEIKSVSQPYSSFGGEVRELSEKFYRRVSERLRHKQRAITMWDYERIVLEEFPSIYRVKCLNHTMLKPSSGGYKEFPLMPGHVTVITIPDLTNKNAVNPLKPYTSIGLLTDIKQYLETIITPFICLQVENPKFEEVEVDFKVVFKKTVTDRGYYEVKLNEDIKKFLSPWAYGEGKDISFGGSIHKSVILDFVEDLSYVEYLTDFKMNHIVSRNPLEKFVDIDEAIASTSMSILVSAEEHIIESLENTETDDRIQNYCEESQTGS